VSDPGPLFRVGPETPLLLFQAESKAAAAASNAWRQAGLTTRTARGRKMRTVDALFDEMAAAMQFPQYFGENWPAFDECLADMDWLPMSVGIVVVVPEPDEVLADSPDIELGVFVRMVASAAKTYAQPISRGESWDRPAVPFHVVLQTNPPGSAQVRARWQAAGAAIADLVI
jgi:hypothetical protein